MFKQLQHQESAVSPITGSNNVTLISTIDCAKLILDYRKQLDIDITGHVKSRETLSCYRCNDSGYRFYHPADVVGDSDFYHSLEANQWYYMPAKWEFDETLKFIVPNQKVLEIGFARGDFMRSVLGRISGVQCTGLELNAEAFIEAKGIGLDVHLESSSQHSEFHRLSYDAVVSFQVLEHIPDPMTMLQDAVSMLKLNGLLVIGVPDCSQRAQSSIFVTSENILNMPPHHQGLWDIPSLSFLQKVLPLKLEYIAVEPAIASHHYHAYRGLLKHDLLRRYGPFAGEILYMLGRGFYNHALVHLKKYLPAHSLLAVFRKVAAS